MTASKVVIVEDESLFRQMLRAQLGADPELEIIGEAANGEDAVRFFTEYRILVSRWF